MDTPISLEELEELVRRDLLPCSEDLKSFFAQVAITPARWRQDPHGHATGGFWAVALLGSRVLWYNEIEGGFNVSRFGALGIIPTAEYWCNQDSLCLALHRLGQESLS